MATRVVRAMALLGVGCSVLPVVGAQQMRTTPTVAELREGFANPPAAARLRCYWWWLNGNTDAATITHDLEEMRARGFGGALLVDANGADQAGNNTVPAGPTFGSPAWVALYTHALKEADRLGLEITLNITSGWNLGGPDVTPEQASKLLTWSRTQVTGGQGTSVRLPQPSAVNGFYRSIAVLAYPLRRGSPLAKQTSRIPLPQRSAAAETGFSMPDATPMLDAGPEAENAALADTSLDEVRDVTSLLQSDGTLAWAAPPGEWEVLRVGYTDSNAKVSTSSGAWQGLAIDYMSRAAFDTYWDHTIAPLLAAAKPYTSLKYLATDSWELKGTNWTDSFAAEFARRRGYDPVRWLPVVAGRIVGDRDQSARFLADLRRTVADLVVANHYDVFAASAAEHGLGVQAESGGPHGAPIDALETFRHAAVPQSEFWSENAHRAKDGDRFFTKEAASAAHIYGQRFVAQEGETSIGPQWSESLAADLKPSFDMAITEGMNRLVWHEFTSSPASTGLPGQEYFAGTHLNPKVTWWNAGGAFFLYLNRVQFLMQQGTSRTDVLYFTGDNVPSFVRLKADDPAHVLPGYDYDATDEDALLHTLGAASGKLTGPAGEQWAALVMPASGRMSLAALEQIATYVQHGGTVIGNMPVSATGRSTPEATVRFHALAAQVWGAACAAGSPHDFGQGKVLCTQDAHKALASIGLLPDVEAATSGTDFHARLDWVHRRMGAEDVYFVRNGSGEASRQSVTFRVREAQVEMWDAVSGERRTIAGHLTADGRTQVEVDLPAYGSAVVMFGDATKAEAPLGAASHEAVTMQGPWTLTFPAGLGAPATPVVMPTLESWTQSAEPGMKYFSGTATYTAKVMAPADTAGGRVLLRFGDVREIARVRVNGHDAGTVWAKPLELRVDPWLKAGVNTLEIEVTNLWPNRIIGDQQPGATQRFTQTNITAYRSDSPLLPSGLMGPVEWVIQH